MGAKPYQDADEIDVELFKVGDGTDSEDSESQVGTGIPQDDMTRVKVLFCNS